MMMSSLDFVARNIALKQGVDHALLRAIVQVESAWKPWAARYEPGYKFFCGVKRFALKNGITEATEQVFQATSWGLCQVMGAVAREDGFDGPLPQLCEAELSLTYGALVLKRLGDKYLNESDVIAAYNAGSPRVHGGRYDNQAYVDKVQAELKRLRAV